jgi:hypothetical protein
MANNPPGNQPYPVIIIAFVFFVGVIASNVGAKTPAGKEPVVASKPVYKPVIRRLTVAEIEDKGIYQAMETHMYRMCIREVPFFLALHKCFYKDPMLDNGDSLMVKKEVIQALLNGAAERFMEKELTGSPATGIDSILIFRYNGKNGKSSSCNIIIYAPADAYDIPKTGAKVRVPEKTRGTVVFDEGTGSMKVTVFSPGVKLELPGYAKTLSFGLITDMDISYAELVPADNAFEARLLYSPKEKDIEKRGWSLNITECNKIRPYLR